MALQEGSSYNTLGADLMNKLRFRAGGTFPVTATRADVTWALGELNKDTSDYMVGIGSKALERAGVRVQGVSESEDRTSDVDFLVDSAERGVSIPEALKHMREKGEDGNGKSKARATAEKMAKQAGKKPGDDDFEATVKKFEKNVGKVGAKKEALTGGRWNSLNTMQQQAIDESLHEDVAGDLDKMREKLDTISQKTKDPDVRDEARRIYKEIGKMKKVVGAKKEAVVGDSQRPFNESRERDMQDFIDQNRGELVAAIQRVAGSNARVDDDEIEMWVNNDEGLYQWAQSEGVSI